MFADDSSRLPGAGRRDRGTGDGDYRARSGRLLLSRSELGLA